MEKTEKTALMEEAIKQIIDACTLSGCPLSTEQLACAYQQIPSPPEITFDLRMDSIQKSIHALFSIMTPLDFFRARHFPDWVAALWTKHKNQHFDKRP